MSITENESQDILGRSDLNDIEAILSITNEDADAIQHIVKDNADAIFTWDYSLSRPALRKLYEKAKVGQWNGSTDLDWSIDVDEEKQVAMDLAAFASGLTPAHYGGTTLSNWGDKEWTEFVPAEEAEVLVELLARFVISFFLAPSQHFDLADPDSARSFFAPFIYAFHPAVI